MTILHPNPSVTLSEDHRMQEAQRVVFCRYLDNLIDLLEEEQETRGCLHRAELEFAMAVLMDEACQAGASERTITLIQAAQVVFALQKMPLGSGVLQ